MTGETSTNCSSNLASILLQTAEIVLENPFNTKEMRVKALLDQGSQRSYLSQRIKSILDLAPTSKENISISTLGNQNSKQSTLEKVCFNLKNESEQAFPIEALSTPFICLPIKNQLNSLAKTRFDYLKDLQLADSSFTDEIDLLIGSDFYWSIATGKTKTDKNNEPVTVETKLGWVLNGPVTSFEVSTNLTSESEYSHILFLNADQSVRIENINFNVVSGI